MDYPAALRPLSEELMVLPLGTTVPILRSRLTLASRRAPHGRFPVRSSPVSRHGDAEARILRLCSADGWSGAIVDGFGRRFLSADGRNVVVPGNVHDLLAGMCSRAVSRLGCFNMVFWKGETVLCAFATPGMRSRLRIPQLRWIALALDCGHPAAALLIIEWRRGLPRA